MLIILPYLRRYSCHIERIIGSVSKREAKLRDLSSLRVRETPRFNKMTISFLSLNARPLGIALLFLSLRVISSVQIKRKISARYFTRGRDAAPLDTFFPTNILFPRDENETALPLMRLFPHIN